VKSATEAGQEIGGASERDSIVDELTTQRAGDLITNPQD
jgi:hypothetical protein